MASSSHVLTDHSDTFREVASSFFAPDPRETERDIAQQEPERADRLQAVLLGYLKSAKAETAKTMPKRGQQAARDRL